MLDLARLLKVAVHITRAAAVAGSPDTAIATVKETLPFLVKPVMGILILSIAVPIVIFTALPNTSSGCESSDTESIAYMTRQAVTTGDAYMNPGGFERTQVDSVVTSVIQEYESRGEVVDHIEVVSHFEEDDLLWLTAINSVAHQQDLNTMSAEDIRDFCASQLRYTTSLGIVGGDDAITLAITVEKLKPEHLMEELGFGEEARIWAGALYKILEEGDALGEYADHLKPYRSDHSDDSGYDGKYEHGDSYGTGVDISRLVSPGTKSNVGLATYAA